MVLVEEITMPNGLTAEVWDNSVAIAADITKVELFVRIRVELQAPYFAKQEHYELVKKIVGGQIFFEYKRERPFVKNEATDKVFQDLLDNFKKNTLPYFSRTSFPRSFALSKYGDIEKNSHKYCSFVGKNHF